jgi:hypothetical protein
MKKSFFSMLFLILSVFLIFLFFSKSEVNAISIEKHIDPKEKDEIALTLCEQFTMNIVEFNKRLNLANDIWSIEVPDHDFFPCYYRATIEGKEYRMRLGGLVEVWSQDGKLEKHLHWSEK